MKKQLLLLMGTVLFSTFSLFAQQPTNGSFETWPSTDVVTGWGTFTQVLAGAGLTGQGLETKNTNATYIKAGTASIKLQAKFISAIGDTVPGSCSLGYWVFNGSSFDAYGQAFTGRPDSIKFAIAYLPAGGDTGIFQAYLTKTTADVGGTGFLITAAVPTMTYVTLPFQYSSANTPDTLHIDYSTGYNTTHQGSIMYVDDVSLIYAAPANPTVSLSVASTSGLESVSTVKLVATLSSASASAITVPVTPSGTATYGVDYSVNKPTGFSFAAGQLKDTIIATIVDDATVESNETIIATLGTPTGGATLGSPSALTYTIVDNDGTPVVPTVSIAAVSSIGEAGGSYNLVATLSQATSVATSVGVTMSGTATNVTDYSLSKTTFSFPAGKSTDTIKVTIVNDVLVEGNETVIATLSSPSACTLGSPSAATTTITDNDVLPTISVAASSGTVLESVGTVKLIATLSAPATSAVTSAVTITGTASNPADYTLSKTSFTIGVGKSTDTIVVTVIDDAVVESSETVIGTLSSPSGATVGSPAAATITINDNDGPPALSISAASASVSEAAGTVKLIATLTFGATGTVTAPVTFSGTAANPADYTLSKTSFSFAAGKVNDTIVVTIVNDVVTEANETVIATLGTPSGATVGTPNATTVTIVDNDGTGIENADLMKSISVYPSPAQGSFNVELPSTTVNHTLSIVDLNGKVVKEATVTVGTTNVSVEGIATGTYTLMFVNATEQKLAGTKQIQIIR
jgi:hypothetical protein